MKVSNKFRRVLYFAAALSLVAANILSGIPASKAYAAGQLTPRRIKISSSAASATNVIYMVDFTTATAGNIGGIVIDFCSNTPIPTDACDALKTDNTTPWTFDVNESSLTVNNQAGLTNALSIDAATTANHLVLTNTAQNLSAGTAISFELGDGTTNGITNIDEQTSFYARIYTYATSADAIAAGTNNVDYGGIALATAQVINITTHVMEQLTFCVYPDDDGGGAGTGTCGDSTAGLFIGHDVNGTMVITASAIDTLLVKFDLSTNAQTGAVVRMKGDTLKNADASADINAAGTTAVAFTNGVERFGLRISNAAATAGTLQAVAPYNGAAGSYALDTSSAAGDTTANVTSTYGGVIADTNSQAVDAGVGTIQFAAAASNTTPAGTYSTTQQLIATGSF